METARQPVVRRSENSHPAQSIEAKRAAMVALKPYILSLTQKAACNSTEAVIIAGVVNSYVKSLSAISAKKALELDRAYRGLTAIEPYIKMDDSQDVAESHQIQKDLLRSSLVSALADGSLEQMMADVLRSSETRVEDAVDAEYLFDDDNTDDLVESMLGKMFDNATQML